MKSTRRTIIEYIILVIVIAVVVVILRPKIMAVLAPPTYAPAEEKEYLPPKSGLERVE